MGKRPIRKARRKARRAKAIDVIRHLAEDVNSRLEGLDKRMTALEEAFEAVTEKHSKQNAD